MGACLCSQTPADPHALSYYMMTSRRDQDPLQVYDLEDVLGEGSMARVWKVRHKVSQDVFALKTISLFRVSKSLIAEMKNEISTLRKLDHPNIIRPLEMFGHKRTICFIMEYCSGGDLSHRQPYTEPQAAIIVAQITAALAYLHENGICHRDIKMENILFENDSPTAAIQLIDFGLSYYFTRKWRRHQVSGPVGTLYSMAPELIEGADCSPASDMWSVGVIAYMLLTNKMPFCGSNEIAMVTKITEGEVSFSHPGMRRCSSAAIHFIRSLLNRSPQERLTAAEAANHTWLKDSYVRGINSPEEVAKLDDRIVESLRQYCTYSKLQKAALMVIAYHSSPAEIGPLRRAFRRFDIARNGFINCNSFRTILSHHGVSDEDEIRQIFESVDLDQSGRIMYTEFLAASLEAMGQLRKEQVMEAFDRLDADADGMISKQDLQVLLGKHGDSYGMERLVERADLQNSGKVSLETFLHLMSHDNRRTMSYTSSDDEWVNVEQVAFP